MNTRRIVGGLRLRVVTAVILALAVAALAAPAAAMAAIAQRGTATTSNSTTSGVTVSKPTGVVAGDVMIVSIAKHGNTTTSTGTGWTLVRSANLGGSTPRNATVMMKVAGASEPARYTFSLGTSAGGDNPGAAAAILAYSGVDNTTPIEATGTLSVQPQQTGVSAAAITSVSSGASIVMFGLTSNQSGTGTGPTFNNGAWSTATSPGALTEIYDYNGGRAVSVGAASATKATAGATGAGSATLSASTRNGGLLVALKPAPVSTVLTVASANQPAGGYVAPDFDYLVDGFTLQRTAGAASISVDSVTIEDTGTTPASTVSGVDVYLDDGNGTWGPEDTLLNITPGTFSGSTVTVPLAPAQSINDTAKQYWVVYTFAPGALDGDVASSRVSAVGQTGATSTTNNAVVGSTFTVDTVSPDASITSPASNAVLTGTSKSITGTASDLGGVSLVEVRIARQGVAFVEYWDGSAWVTDSDTWLSATGTTLWSYAWTFDPAVQDGVPPYTIDAQATDFQGNVGSATPSTNVTIENVPPTAEITAPTTDQVFTGLSTQIAGSSADTSVGVASVDVTIQRDSDSKYWDGTGWVDAKTWLPATGTTSWTYDWTFDPARQSGDVTYTIGARATDSAGNEGMAADITGVTINNVRAINPSAGSGGTIDPSVIDIVAYGDDSQTYTATPDPGYRFSKFMDGAAELPATDVGGGKFAYQFLNVTENHDIAASFVQTYTIAATAGDHGLIDPTGDVSVDKGANQTFTFTPATGYHVDTLAIGGGSAETTTATSYTFTDVQASSSIHVTFAINTYTLLYAAGPGGTLTGDVDQVVDYGASGTQVTAVPNAGYRFVQWSDGLATASRTDSNVTADKSVTASFVLNENWMTVWRFRNAKAVGSYLWTPDPAEKASILALYPKLWLYEGPAFQVNTANPLNQNTLWRFRNKKTWTYLYTADPVEKANIQATLSGTWVYEGPAWDVSLTQTSQPVWRFKCLKNTTYLWTMDPNEKLTIETTLKDVYKLEGIAYYLGQ